MSKYIINLDLHGGDFAPQSVLEGALIAQTKNSSIKFNLHSDRHIFEKFESSYSKLFNNSKWTQSENFISPDMKPSDALKKDNRNSSMSNAILNLKENKNQITISAGNTGAMMAYSTVYLRTIENITRPAIASFFPSEKHPVCFLDLGANAECNSENLLDFAVMGSTYYKVLYPQIDTKVALLNIGSEELKGNNLIQETHELMKSDKRINYQGFVEANEITSTNNHVIVTDGFSGNIALKTAEGVSKFITDSLKKKSNLHLFLKNTIFTLKKKFQRL